MDEYHECSQDWWHRDELFWATPAVITTVGGVLVKFAFDSPSIVLRLLLLSMGEVWISAMIHAMIKHCYYAQGSEEKLRALQMDGQMLRKIYPKRCSTNSLFRFLERYSARASLKASSCFVWLVVLFLILYTLWQIMFGAPPFI